MTYKRSSGVGPTVWLRPEFKRWNIEALLENIRCPLLLIQGLKDEYGTPAQIERIAAVIPTSHVVLLDSCGHSPHVEQTTRVLEAIERFLPNCCLKVDIKPQL